MYSKNITNAYVVILPEGRNVQIAVYDKETYDEISQTEELNEDGIPVKCVKNGLIDVIFFDGTDPNLLA